MTPTRSPGPYIPPGGTVTWTYVVTNTGNSQLTDVTLEDDQLGPITCPAEIEPLDAGETVTCTATGTAAPDQYANTAVVTGTTPLGGQVEASDPSHYFGAVPGILVEKLTNGDDADEAPGPLIGVGDPVTWTYVVTNSGNEALTDVTLEDDQLGPVTCPQDTLAVGAEMTCTATGIAQIGQYENLATVTAVGHVAGRSTRRSPTPTRPTTSDSSRTSTSPSSPTGKMPTSPRESRYRWGPPSS